MARSTNVNLTVPSNLEAEIRQIAARDQEPLSTTMRRLIRDGIRVRTEREGGSRG